MQKINKRIVITSLCCVILAAGLVTWHEMRLNKSPRKTVTIDGSYIKLNINQLKGASDVIAIGSVKGAKSFVVSSDAADENKMVYTKTIFQVEKYLYNPEGLTVDEINIEMPGGIVSNLEVIDADVPQLSIGRRYVVFLEKNKNRNDALTILGPQGIYEIDKDGNIGVGENQQMLAKDVFGGAITSELLNDKLSTVKPEPIPGEKIK